MLNFAVITTAVQAQLVAGLTGYNINRNARLNTDPNVAARTRGWINVQRGSVDYQGRTIGAQPWHTAVAIRVEVQVASIKSGEDAEDKLQAAEMEILDVLEGNRKLGGTVDQVTGYSIAYAYNDGEQIWHHAAIITINAEVRS